MGNLMASSKAFCCRLPDPLVPNFPEPLVVPDGSHSLAEAYMMKKCCCSEEKCQEMPPPTVYTSQPGTDGFLFPDLDVAGTILPGQKTR